MTPALAASKAAKKVRLKQGKGYYIVNSLPQPSTNSTIGNKRLAAPGEAKVNKSSKKKSGTTANSRPFDGFVFAISGTMKTLKRVEFETALLANGAAKVKKGFTKDVTHLIVPDVNNPGESSKVVKAQQNSGTQMVGESWVTERWSLATSSSSSSSSSSSPTTFPMSTVMLAHKYVEEKHSKKVIGWYLSEKLDGLRAVYNGTMMFSRAKNPYDVPLEFMAEFPNMILDGELHCGEGNFATASSVVKTKNGSYSRWVNENVIYAVFDAPTMGGTFEDRMKLLAPMLAGKKHITLCQQTVVKSVKHIETELKKVVDKDGEGLMLRDPKSEYVHKRSNSLLKVKVFHDTEAVVIEHTVGQGRNAGRVGALVCKMPSGKTFQCGSGLCDDDRENPPPIGCTITYRYFEVTKAGVPRFPSFLRIREDA